MRFFPSVLGFSPVACAVMVIALLAGFQPQAMSALVTPGITGQYFDNPTFTQNPPNTPSSRIDAAINFPPATGGVTGMNLNLLTPPINHTDNISVRWTGQITPLYGETYTFYTDSDDGSRLWIGGQLVVDNNFNANQDHWEASGTITLAAGVSYDLQVDYKNNGGGGSIVVSWSSLSQAKQVIPQVQLAATPSGDITAPTAPTNLLSTGHTDAKVNLNWTPATDNNAVLGYNVFRDGLKVGFVSGVNVYVDNGLTGNTTYTYTVQAIDIAGNPSALSNALPVTTSAGPPAGTGTGLTGTYFPSFDFTGTSASRVDPTVAFSWGTTAPFAGPPAIGGGASDVSIRWTGRVQPLYSEIYTFYVSALDKVRLLVNGVELVNQDNTWYFAAHPFHEWSGATAAALVAGQTYTITLEEQHAGWWGSDATNGTGAFLSWSSDSVAKQIVPQLQLYPVLNNPPVVTITAPTANQAFPNATNSVTVTASATDAEGDAITGWSISDGTNTWNDGGVGGNNVSHAMAVVPGTTTFTVTATQAGGGAPGSATVTITVNLPPVVHITAPTVSQVFPMTTVNVTVTANATDVESDAITGWTISDGINPTWNDGGAGGNNLSHAMAVVPSLTPITFTVTATEAGGAVGTATVTITVSTVNLPPVVTITAPTANQVFPAGTATVTVTAGATDLDLDPITGWAITADHLSAPIGTSTWNDGGTGGTPVSRVMAVTPGVYQFTATATSGVAPQNGSAHVHVVVLGAGSPTATITTTASAVTSAAAIPFTVTFSAPVTGFVVGAVTVTNGTVGNWAGSGAVYTFTVTPTVNGLVTVNVPAGVAFVGADPNTAATPVSVTADNSGPTVTINQATGQRDPTYVQPVAFDVVFSAPVTGFTAADVVTGGTAPGTRIVSVTGSGATYRVTVAGITGAGTLTVAIPDDAAQSTVGNHPSHAATTTDNTVTMVAPPEKKKRCGLGTGFVVLGGMLWLLLVGIWLALRSKPV